MSNKNIKSLLDTVETFLTKQGEFAIVGDECIYKTEEGLKCGVGCLIPENLYKEDYEHKAIKSEELVPIVNHVATTYKLSRKITSDILEDIQVLHDDAARNSEGFNVEFLKEGFKTLYEKYAKESTS